MRAINPQGGPRTGGPYSPAVEHRGLLYCSGQIGLDPTGGELVAGGVIQQARQAFANLAFILEAGGSDLQRVLRVGIYLVAVEDFAAVNDVFEEVFDGHRPARTTIGVNGLPLGAVVEVDCLASTEPHD